MGKNHSLVKNLGWQTIYQIIATCMPLITSPYLSRVLGAGRLGEFSYTFSLALFFQMFAMLGNNNYGTREIAKTRNNIETLTVLFKELITMQIVFSTISLAAYYSFCALFENNRIICIIQSLWIIDCFINISWLYTGLEEFRYTAIRGVAIKILQLFAILFFVKQESDINIYVFIMSFSAILSNLILWLGIKRYVNIKIKISFRQIKKHLKPSLILFLPVAAASVFHLMDKMMLGRMSTSVQSGYYYNSDHLVNIPMLIVSGLCTVMLSRLSHVNDNRKLFLQYFERYSELIMIIGIAMACGISAIANEFVPFFFGEEFVPCVYLVYIFSIIMIIKTISNILMSMYLIPTRKDKIYVKAVIIGAIVNLLFNVLFIWKLKMGALGATLGTFIAEFAVVMVEMILIRETIGISNIIKKIIPYICFGGIMHIIVRVIAVALKGLMWNIAIIILVEIIVGAIVFICLTMSYFIMTNKYDYFKKIILGKD